MRFFSPEEEAAFDEAIRREAAAYSKTPEGRKQAVEWVKLFERCRRPDWANAIERQAQAAWEAGL